MSVFLIFFVMVLASYLLGAIPWGLIVGKLIGKVDVRGQGSGNIGATNVLRTIGLAPAILVLLLDLGKGLAPILVSRLLIGLASINDITGSFLEAGSALSVIMGHNWSIFLKFKGGRGIATGLGSLAILTPWVTIGILAIGLPIIGISRIVSLGNTIGALLTGLTLLVLSILGIHPIAYGIYGVIASAIVLFRHRQNILRIIGDTESRLGSA